MSALVIVDIEVTDSEDYDEYKQLALPAVILYGRKTLSARRSELNAGTRLEFSAFGHPRM